MTNHLTRRQLLTRIAAVGGAVPLAKAMGIMGLWQLSDNALAGIATDADVDPNQGAGKTVAIIGAGLSGLAAAYELSRRGYSCEIFEADKRPKGRTFTVRPNGGPDSWYQEAGKDRPVEHCSFDEIDGPGSLYFEAGAGRIPSHHRTVLHYCKQFGVPLESYIFGTRSNLVRSENFNDGKPVQLRRFKHNLRGYLAEMFRTADSDRLNGVVSPEEQEALLDSLSKSFGELNDEGRYPESGASHAGYSVQPGPGDQPGELFKPFAFADLLKAKDIWESQLYNDMRYYWQTSLMQPVGGIDNIAATFLRQPANDGKLIGQLVKLHHKVTEIRVKRTKGKVEIVHRHVDHQGNLTDKGKYRSKYDYCISTIAPSLLRKTRNDFDRSFKRALKSGNAVTDVHAGKVAWQSDRFWESDKYYIYGGISWTTDFNTQIWYPSAGFNNKRGILTGAYVRGDAGTEFGQLTREERIARSLEGGINLHPELDPNHSPQYNDLSKAMTISWQNMAFQAGGWFSAPSTDDQKDQYQILLDGQHGRFFMGGDAMSYTPGWMEGAVAAGCMAAENIIGQA